MIPHRKLFGFITASMLVCLSSSAQSTWGMRLNQNTDIFSVTYIDQAGPYKERKVGFSRLSLAASYTKGKYVQEVELFIPQVNASAPQFPWKHIAYNIPGLDTRVSNYSLRYSIGRKIYSFTKSFSFTLGAALNPYYLKSEGSPTEETYYIYFYRSYTDLGVSLNLIPGISAKASKHLSFVLDWPIKIFDYYHQTHYIKNPAIPVSMRKQGSDHADFFMNAFTWRLGVSYNF